MRMIGILALILLGLNQGAWAQSRQEVTPGGSEPGIEVLADGTTVLRAEELPSFIVIQNLFFMAHQATASPAHWENFLSTLELKQSSHSAAVLLAGANAVWELAQRVGPGPIAKPTEEDLVRLVASEWKKLRDSLASEGSTEAVDAFVDGVVRRQTSLVIPPDSSHDLAITVPELEATFQEKLIDLEAEQGRR